MVTSMEKHKGNFQILSGVSILRMVLKHRNRNLKEVGMSLVKSLFLFAGTEVLPQTAQDV